MSALPADPAFWAAAVAAMLIAGLAKGGFGGGAAFAATPLLALTVPAPVALGIMLPLLSVMDVTSLWAYRGRWSARTAAPLLVFALIGVGAAVWLFRSIDPSGLQMVIGLTAIAFAAWRGVILWQALRPSSAAAPTVVPQKPPAFWSAPLWGALAGFTSMTAHAGGPVLAMHLLRLGLSKTEFQATTVLFFFGVNLIKLGPFIALGLITAETLPISLALAPLAALGALLGVRAHKAVSETAYYRVIVVLLMITGGKLVWDGLQGLSL